MQQLKLFLAAVAIAFAVNASAQENKLFNHLSIGYTLGTDGLIGFDVASPIGNYVAVRAGYTFMPKFKADVDVNYKVNDPLEDRVSATSANRSGAQRFVSTSLPVPIWVQAN